MSGTYNRGRTMLLKRLPSDVVEEHLNVFLSAPQSIYLGHIASASVLLFMASFNPAVPLWFMIVWGVMQIVGYPVLMEIWARKCRAADRSASDNYRWIEYMDLLCFVVGLSWGAMFYLSLNPDNAAHFAIQMSIAAGATSAAVRSLATFPRSFIVYSVPMLGLLILKLVLLGGDFILLGGLVAIFLLMLLMSGRDVMEAVSRYIAIKNENLDLADRYRKAAADADHANREKTRLLAAASHDLRQPIHAIGLHLATLPTENMDDQSQTTLSRIRNSLQTLTKLFNSLLDVSLLDAGKVKVKTSHFNLKDLLDGVMDDYEPLAEIAHVTLVLECAPVGVVGDPVLLRRMVQNLLSNAIRYSNGGTVQIDVQIDEESNLQISVSDEGPGIAEEHHALIFEEFTQLASQHNPLEDHAQGEMGQDKGLGLGLAIVKRLSDMQGLSLKMETSSKGTCLTICGLKAGSLPKTQTITQKPSGRIDALFQSKHVLVADDDIQTLEATAGLLQKWGCKVSLASSLDDINPMAQIPDLVVSDFSFEGHCTGLDIIAKAYDVYHPDIPALIVSGDSSEGVQQQVKEAGYLLIHKPVQPVQLRSALLDIFLSGSKESEPQDTPTGTGQEAGPDKAQDRRAEQHIPA
ncbi:MAG: ATP-binding protein [Cohaesibacter sp.]|nr:ATP-binding protein [Cohaesibacter sp.]